MYLLDPEVLLLIFYFYMFLCFLNHIHFLKELKIQSDLNLTICLEGIKNNVKSWQFGHSMIYS